MSNQRYEKVLQYIASALAKWRFEEGLSIEETASNLNMSNQRVEEALLANDWSPTIYDIAVIEDATGQEIFTLGRNKNFK